MQPIATIWWWPHVTVPPFTAPSPSFVVHGPIANDRPVRVSPALLDVSSVVPRDAGWADVTMYAVNGETIGVLMRGEKPRHLHAIELGMAHEVTRNPTKRFTLLLHLCARRGRTDWKSARHDDDWPLRFDNFAAFKMQAYALRRSLQRAFGLPGDPFASFGKRRDLVTAFRALPASPGEMRYCPGSSGASRRMRASA